MLTWIAGNIYRFRWLMLVSIFALTLAAVIVGSGVFNALESSGGIQDPNAQSTIADNLISDKLSNGAVDVVILMSSAQYKVGDPAFEQEATQMLNKLKASPDVVSVTSWYSTRSADLLSRDDHETIALLQISRHGDKTANYEAIAPLITSPILHIEIGGGVVADQQFNHQLQSDLAFAGEISLPIVMLLLIFIFGGVVAALLPLLIGGFAIMCTFAILRIIAPFVAISDFAINVAAFIGLGLAIDYSLLVVTRFREELSHGEQDVRGALQRTMATAGRTILFSGLTVSTSLIGLLLFPEVLLKSIGLAAIITAVVAMLGVQIVLATLLALLGKRVNALSFQRLLRRGKKPEKLQTRGAWYRLSFTIMRFSIPVMLATIAVLLLLGSPFLGVKLSTASENVLPPGSAKAVNQQLKQNFPNQGGNGTEIDIAIQTPGSATSASNLATLYDYVNKVAAIPGVSGISSLVSVDPQLSLAQYQQLYAHPALNPQLAAASTAFANHDLTKVIVDSNDAFDSSAATNIVQKIRAIVVPHGFVPLVGGDTADQLDLFTSLDAHIPSALAVMVIAIFLLLFLMTGSLIMPFKAIILNVLSLSATFGALVWIFQEGHLQSLLGFQSVGSLDSTQPVLVFAIAFGLSMDYEVFLLSRIKELFDKTGDNRQAVALGLQRTGQLITSAAMLQALVVGAFATSQILQVKQLGLGVALAIVMDATLVRVLLVPAMMNLLGKWNWWAPKPLQAFARRVGLREAVEAEPEPTLIPLLVDKQVDEEQEPAGV
jgi:trehalose monomycolate/heme transporter